MYIFFCLSGHKIINTWKKFFYLENMIKRQTWNKRNIRVTRSKGNFVILSRREHISFVVPSWNGLRGFPRTHAVKKEKEGLFSFEILRPAWLKINTGIMLISSVPSHRDIRHSSRFSDYSLRYARSLYDRTARTYVNQKQRQI